MNVIFLDFNGVLDTYDNMDEINKDNLNRLKRIVQETNASVVISSSLKNSFYYLGRLSTKLKSIITDLNEAGIKVIGFTHSAETREEEILIYLANHPEIDNYCIIDDEFKWQELNDHLVKLIPQREGGNGLRDEDVLQAINILNNIKKTR